MTYRRALERLEARRETRIRLGLGRIRAHLRRLGDPQGAFASVHVAGTNAKGSVCAMLDSVFRSAGWKTGLYTSPHLLDVRERIRIDGRPIPRRDFARVLEKILKADRDGTLTYFEALTAMAFQYFREKGAEIAVLETGLGGRYDATNVVERPLASVVTTIDYDHMQFLGSTLGEIAREKAGIFKRGCPAICGETKPAALRVLSREASRKGAPLRLLPRRAGWRMKRSDWRRGAQVIAGPGGRKLRLGVLGSAQARNAAVVLMAIEAVREAGFAIPDRAVERGLARVRWPGRFQTARLDGRWVVLDGAHNPEAMRHFRATLGASPWGRSPKTFVVGVLRDKAYREMLRILARRPGMLNPGTDRVIATEPPSPRALSCGELAREIHRAAPRARVSAIADPAEALNAWAADGGPAAIRAAGQRRGERPRASRAPVACVCGSFYLVGSALKILGRRS